MLTSCASAFRWNQQSLSNNRIAFHHFLALNEMKFCENCFPVSISSLRELLNGIRSWFPLCFAAFKGLINLKWKIAKHPLWTVTKMANDPFSSLFHKFSAALTWRGKSVVCPIYVELVSQLFLLVFSVAWPFASFLLINLLFPFSLETQKKKHRRKQQSGRTTLKWMDSLRTAFW